MRYEGTAKMGFYPTPPTMTEKITNRLHFTGPARVYDPCCGDGTALGTVAKMAPAGSISYGIELDGARELEARKILTHTVRCGYEFARVEPASMNLIWLNPPYDGADGSGGNVFRKELQFLRDVSKHVAPGGILVFIIPRTSLYRDMVDALTNRYTDLTVYQFEVKLAGRASIWWTVIVGLLTAAIGVMATLLATLH